MGLFGSNKQKSSSTSRSSQESRTFLAGGQREQLKELWGQSRNLLEQGHYGYGPGRVAGFGQNTQQALGSAGANYEQGRANTAAANQMTNATLRGDYLDPASNPWLQRTHDIGARNMTRKFYGATNALGSRMAAAGRAGGGAHGSGQAIAEENLATGLGDFTANLYGNNYQQERSRQMGAVGQSAANTQAGWMNTANLATSGDRDQQQRQAELTDMVGRFNFEQYGRAQKLQEFSQMLGGPITLSQSSGRSRTDSKGKGSGFNIL